MTPTGWYLRRFGNLPGWALAAVVWLVAGYGLWAHEASQRTTPPTDFFRTLDTGEMRLPIDARDVLSMDRPGDAGEAYRQILSLVAGRADAYDPHRPIAEGDPALSALLRASGVGHATTFLDPRAYGPHRQAEAFKSLAAAAARRALEVRDRDPSKARAMYEGIFTLGHHLFSARRDYPTLAAGLSLLGIGAQGLGRTGEMTGDADLSLRAVRFEAARAAFDRERVRPTYRVLASPDNAVADRHFGDVLRVARHTGEHVWRHAAILQLGRYRYTASRPADRAAAERFLRHTAERDADPSLRQTAETALSLDRRTLHRGG